jgi:fermentation-respiration switch protein FrsA (DUF1100 family)
VSCLVGTQNYEDSDTPLLVISGSDDQVVAFESARQAYDAANPPKYLLELLGGNHLRFADGDLSDFAPGTLEAVGGGTFLEDALRIIQATGADPTACPQAESHPQTLAGERQHELTQLFVTAFFDYYLKGDEGTSYVLTAQFAQTVPEVELEISQPSSE